MGDPASVSHATSETSPPPRARPVRNSVCPSAIDAERKRGQSLRKGFQLPVPALPIQPCQLVVLAVGIVVALLRAAELVTGRQHDRTA